MLHCVCSGVDVCAIVLLHFGHTGCVTCGYEREREREQKEPPDPSGKMQYIDIAAAAAAELTCPWVRFFTPEYMAGLGLVRKRNGNTLFDIYISLSA